MKFNERTDKQPSFGPDFWEGDAIVAGESRGKIWRCPLVKTSTGHVGKPILIASLDMLTLDVVVSPKGDLLVCCHSGKPDWGTGPKGMGRVFKISYTDREAPQPVIAWPDFEDTVRVAFDKALDDAVLTTAKTLIAGKYVRAADRIELLKPPYAAVKQQEATPHTSVRVLSASLADDDRTLVLKTEPLPFNSPYSLAIAGVKARGASGPGVTVDVDFTLNGVAGEWFSKGSDWTWHPHLASEVNARWTRSLGNRYKLLRPQPRDSLGIGIPIQPRAFLRTIVDLPGTRRVVHLTSSVPFDAGIEYLNKAPKNKDRYALDVPIDNIGPAALTMHTSARTEDFFDASYHTDEDPHERPIPFDRLILPWAKNLPLAPDAPIEHKPRGDWARGKTLFFGEAKCSTCHVVRGEGGTLGPDLSNLTFKDPDAVLNDILAPSAAINPDYISYNVKLKNGGLLTGLVTADGDQFKVTEGVDKITTVRRADVQSMTPGTISIMPEGFKDLGNEKLNDLLEFLTGEQPKK